MKNLVVLFLLIALFLGTGCNIDVDDELVDAISGQDQVGTDGKKGGDYGGGGHGHHGPHGGHDYSQGYMDGCHPVSHHQTECFREEAIYFYDEFGHPIEHVAMYLEHKKTRTATGDLETGYDGAIFIDHYYCGNYDIKLIQDAHNPHGFQFKADSRGVVASIDFCRNRQNYHHVTLRRHSYHR